MSEKLLNQALHKITKYLSFRSNSEKELKQKLSKNFPLPIIEKALRQAQQKNWLEEPLELSQKTTEKLQNKNKSWLYIKTYLKNKELPLPLYNREKELEKALTLLQKLLQDKPKQNQLQMKRFLASRLFEIDIIEETLRNWNFKKRR